MSQKITPRDLLAAKRREVKYGKQDIPVDQLRTRIEKMLEPARSLATIHGHFTGIIGEIRTPQTPLANLFDPRIWGQEMAGAGCAGVAVCTDTFAHDGDRFYLRRARRYMPLPVIRLDYAIDPYQVYETRVYQGDAVIIPELFLDDDEIGAMLSACAEVEIGGLVLVEDAQGARRAVDLGARLIYASPLIWDWEIALPEEVIEAIARAVPEPLRLIGYLPELTEQSVTTLAELGYDAVLGGTPRWDPTEASQSIRQLIEFERRPREA